MDGLLIVNKPAGITSHDVVERVRKILKIRRVGHTGTLDPMATGVLVLCIGRATKLTQFLQSDTKEYIAEMRLGIRTDTQDSTGKILSEVPCSITPGKMEKIFEEFRGDVWQVPPMTSAVKMGGRPLYKLASRGREVKRPRRRVKIFELELLKIDGDDHPRVKFRVKCSKGAYIRTLCADIGEALGCGAYMSGLTRISCGNFHLDSALAVEKVEKLAEENRLHKAIIPMNKALERYPFVLVKGDFKEKILNGVPLRAGMIENQSQFIERNQFIRLIDVQKDLFAIAKATTTFSDRVQIDPARVIAKPVRVFS